MTKHKPTLKSIIVKMYRNGDSLKDVSKAVGKSKQMCKEIYIDEKNRRAKIRKKAVKKCKEVRAKRPNWTDLLKIRNETLNGISPSHYGFKICHRSKHWACGTAP